ncbi:GNAT family N-acetyltransferase [Streptomyces sp. NBC_00385]|uniref:GNAT family N-acetyltransferase n=1 Tax=Streptomyces sp. NBC_00385 TaxID=2975733 RepID=UPI002DDBB167|nr:GNAT family N-acetyltransferase [Streptomyces sp. NBC_00385]WRZ02673.1 GNAT family N-acetyltransferase [Streptomyces sp. NBC_00385]
MNETLITQLRTAYDAQLRGVTPPGGSVRIEKDGPLTRVVGWHRGFVTGPRDLGVYGAELDTLIARQRDFYAARGEAVEWKTRAHDLPADLTGRLTAAGFVAEDSETVVIGRSADLAADPVLPEGVTLRRVTSRSDLQRVAVTESTVWNEDWSWLADDLTARIENAPENTVVLVAEAGTEVVCAAWLVFKDGIDFGGLWGGSTLKEWRGQGIYRALVAHRARLAAARGVPYVYVDASADSAPILTRLGLHAVTTTTPYVWSP